MEFVRIVRMLSVHVSRDRYKDATVRVIYIYIMTEMQNKSWLPFFACDSDSKHYAAFCALSCQIFIDECGTLKQQQQTNKQTKQTGQIGVKTVNAKSLGIYSKVTQKATLQKARQSNGKLSPLVWGAK